MPYLIPKQLHFYHSDHLGSVRAITDSTGSITNSYTYDAYGNALTATETITNPYRFTGREYDPETGLHYYRARYYDSNAGRFINEDPLLFVDGLNANFYVGNNPANWVDSWGTFTLNDAIDSLIKRGVDGDTFIGDYTYSDTQIFNEWLRLEQTNTEWLKELPGCPRKIYFCGDDPINPDSNTWEDIGSSNKYHPGAEYETRSKTTPGGHTNQCTYDRRGNVLSTIPAAGSADLKAGGFNTGHYFHDVDPFYMARDLERLEDYYSVRPIILE